MYIVKNALRCIARAKGRSILIGMIALVIAVSACIGLSIRQAAESAKKSALDGMSVTATIGYDRAAAMGGGGKPGMGGGFNRNELASMMGGAALLSLAEYQTYARAESVQDFYYTLTAYFDGSDDLVPISNDTAGSEGAKPEMGGGMHSSFGTSGDFSLIGYSGDNAMLSFIDGTASILDGGSMFAEGTTEAVCVISEELAIYNGLSVGDTVIITNPSLTAETYRLTVSGIYTSTETNDFSMSMHGRGQDPANEIYMSAAALQAILDASSVTSTDTCVMGVLSATYTFESTDDYYLFEEQVRELGLDDAYTVSSPDITAFENRLTPLKTLGTMAGWFLIVILIIGAVILVVLNIFNVRERKYEVGVLTAMGMKKWKVATQFMCEILVITMLAVILGVGIGAVSAVPVTNALLEGQIENQTNQQNQMDKNFGRPGNMGGGLSGGDMEAPPDIPSDIGGKGPFGNMLGGAADYISEVNSAMDLSVVLKMLGVGLLLTLIASAASVLFIMRYDPLKILANRD